MVEKIKIVSNGISIDLEQLKWIIINKWKSGHFYRHYYNQGVRGEYLYQAILSEIADYVDGLCYETERKAQKNLGRSGIRLDWFDEYPKSDVRSIGFEVANKLSIGSGSIEKLTVDDIPFILEFLNTSPDKILEAWNKWEKYWNSLDYLERRRKLLVNSEK